MLKSRIDDLIHQSRINCDDKDKKTQQYQLVFNAAMRLVFKCFVLLILLPQRQHPDEGYTDYKTKHREA
ncbi:hypothetical protein SDC9_203534 [bioreactor metagenome]|uniref:Uncharacterized protein n=1 Tax=bioreactor metagenome TaxID=1076179 RepID=A0A645IY90_9ZZZZ